MYTTPSSVHSVARAPTLVSPTDPVKIPRKLSANFGESLARSGKIKASKKVKPGHEHKPEAQQEKARQTHPTGLFHLPGVDPRDAKQAEEGHDDGQGVDDGPHAGGDGRQEH